MLDVEVAYATAKQQVIVALKIPENATVSQAISASGLLERFPEIDSAAIKTGIFGCVCNADHRVQQGDRVEIYRPLHHDPKEARRQRAAKK